MKCPQCNAVQNDGATECAACGIIFARWRPSTRPATRPGITPTVAPASSGLNPIVVVIVLILFVAGGISWTKWAKRKLPEATAASGDELLDQTNKKQLEARKNISAAEMERRRNTPPRDPRLREIWEQQERRAAPTRRTGTKVVQSDRVKAKRQAYEERKKREEEAEQRVREWQAKRQQTNP